ncbi:MAG: hypothetical protein U0271_19750 [Polyangiaceae bacterium]
MRLSWKSKRRLAGLMFGLVVGLTYWFVWGCDRCARGMHPAAVLAIFVVPSIFMFDVWFADHARFRDPDERASR